MDVLHTTRRAQTATSAGMDHSEEMIAEVDEPPDERHFNTSYHPWSPRKLAPHSASTYIKAQPPPYARRESLLTRQLHSETEHTEDEELARPPLRGLSTTSTWSNQSTSTADLTSDDGHSVASPAISPPLPPTRSALPITEKPLAKEPVIFGHDEFPKKAAQDTVQKKEGSEQRVEADLGRKRCITFACGRKNEAKPTSPPKAPEPEKAASPPKRKCLLRFNCPTRAGAQSKPVEEAPKRSVSPPPERPIFDNNRTHRGSDSTVTASSPKASRKSPATTLSSTSSADSKSDTASAPVAKLARTLSNDSDEETEATRFREFESTENEPEAWVQESTCHRSRLTVNDTLKKENVIRQIGEEVEEEVLEEDDVDDEDDADVDGIVDEVDGDDDDVDEDDLAGSAMDRRHLVFSEENESDAGFHTDDEEGFAASDDEDSDGGSDMEWWTPGVGRSTAATSTDHLEHLTTTHFKHERAMSGSSLGSHSSGHMSVRSSTVKFQRRARRHRHNQSHAMPISRPNAPELPDSTDFVCGTLDEDRPVEQAYINRMKQREAQKHKFMPQDIDPTFPTSDPEMDEEDDEDLEDPEESEEEELVHGDMEELHGTVKRMPSPRPQRRSQSRSPPPPAVRRPSPAPKRISVCRSPPPPARRPSPPPAKRPIARSPPINVRRNTARSPPPRKLFGHSPSRARSPAPSKRMTSPPNSRRASADGSPVNIGMAISGLAERPTQLTHTASLPRNGFLISKLAALREDEDEGSDTAAEVHKRGAIDIYKGLEKKRRHRKEKMWQKHCAKAAAKGEKAYKVKPGKGCERMREVGLQLQNYQGKGQHILSM